MCKMFASELQKVDMQWPEDDSQIPKASLTHALQDCMIE